MNITSLAIGSILLVSNFITKSVTKLRHLEHLLMGMIIAVIVTAQGAAAPRMRYKLTSSRQCNANDAKIMSIKHKRTLVASVTVLVVAAFAILAQAAIPLNFFTVVDQGGANDVQSAQVDLTQLGRDDTDSTEFKLFWSWDAVSVWTGSGQTGDACSLFDTDGDGNVNYVVCGQVSNPNADPTYVMQTPGSPFVFSCTDARNDRCSQPTGPLSYNSSEIQSGAIGTDPLNSTANLITNTDPFPNLIPDQEWPNDTTLEIHILKSYLPANATLVNVCTYPSAGNGGNNNPFDCVITPGGGYLVINKDAGSDTTTPFVFTVAPTSPQPNYTIIGTNSTPSIGLAIGNSVSVTETVPAGWNLTAASCTLQGGASTGTKSGDSVTGITIESGKVTTCNFTDIKGPALTVIKTNDGTRDNAFNDIENVSKTATYPYTVTYNASIVNNGGAATINSITDDKTSSLTLTGSSTAPAGATACADITSIAAGQTLMCYYDVLFQNANTPQVINTITVIATNNAGTDTKTDTSTVNFVQNPLITIDKTSTTTSVTAAGQVVPYSYNVTNTGNVNLTNVNVSDNMADTPPGVVCPETTLAPGVSMTCTANHTVTQDEMNADGNLTNIGIADSDQTEPVQDTLDIPISQTKSMTIDKTSTTTSVTAAGQVVPYSYLVNNTGTVTLTNVNVTDDMADTPPGVTCPETTLAPGESMTCTANHTVTQAEMDADGNLTNIGIADSDQTEPVQDTLDIPISQTKSMTIDKTSTTVSVTAAGQVVPYSYLVNNTGTVTLTNVNVTDDMADTPPGVTCPETTLAPGVSMTCTANHTVTQAEINANGNLTNIGIADSDQTDPIQDTLEIPISQTKSMTIDKTSTTTSVTAAGQVVPYSYLVNNTGTVTLTNVNVSDSMADTPPGVVCPETTLAPGVSMTCTANHTVTQDEINAGGNLTNIGIADSDQTDPVQDTLDIPIVSKTADIAPTGTDPTAFFTDSFTPLAELLYTVNSKNPGVIASVSPGQFFYYNKLPNLTNPTTTIRVTQSDLNNDWDPISPKEISLWNCGSLPCTQVKSGVQTSLTSTDAILTTTSSGLDFVVRVSYPKSPQSLKGTPISVNSTDTYTFQKYINNVLEQGSVASIDVVPKP